jgi:hypothetical protein
MHAGGSRNDDAGETMNDDASMNETRV